MRKVLGVGIAVMAAGMLRAGSALAVGTSGEQPWALPPSAESPGTIIISQESLTWDKFFDSFVLGESAGYERYAWERPLPWAPFYPMDADVDQVTGEAKEIRKINPRAYYGAWGLHSAEDPSYFSKAELYYFRQPFYFFCNSALDDDPTKRGVRFGEVVVFFNSHSVLDHGQETMIREGFVVDRAGQVLAAFDSIYDVSHTQDGTHSGAQGTSMKSYRMLDPETAEVKTRWDFLRDLFLKPTPSGSF